VFQIGSSLREARERRGLDLATVEHETRIRARWLSALEEERFDLLPERIYALGFLRTYAEYVGLDPQPFVDELSSRLPQEDAHDAPPPLLAASRSRMVRPAIAVAGTLLVTVALGALIANRTGGARHPPPAASPPVRHVTSPPPATSELRPRPKLATLVLVAVRGRCWLDARLGSRLGRELYSGTLESGRSLRLRGRRIWIRLGAPSALDATLNQRPVALPTVTPANVVVTASALRLSAG
jgi:hypothetical protein